MTSKQTTKPLTKLQEMNLRALKLKEESITTILTTIKNNQTFAKLLIFTLNSLETFVSPPNREIRINSNIIIRLEGVELLHIISVKNIKNNEIVELAGDIIYKLISVYDIIDKELTKLFAEKNGHLAVIDIVLKKNKDDKSILPYIKIINGLAQIPQLVPTLIENNIIEAINLNSDLDEKNKNYDGDFVQLNLNTLKQISAQKAGRDYLINKNYIEKILNNIIKSSDKKDVTSVLCGLGILENLCRNEEGKMAVKNSNCINCLSHVLSQLGHEQSILKMCAKIYCKIASAEDLKNQLELLRKYYEENNNSGKYDKNFVEINKSLELVSNFMLVDELGMQLQEPDNFELLKNLFIQIQQINLDDKEEDFLNLFISLNKNFMIIFYRLFNLDEAILEKNKDLMKYILASVSKNWESIKDLYSQELLKVFNTYFVSYGNIVNQNYNLIEKNKEDKIDPDFVNTLIYINKNILTNGKKNLNVDDEDSNPHFIAGKLMKICDELSLKEDSTGKTDKTKDIITSLISCYPYLEFLFINKEEEEILCNSLEVIFDLANAQKDFRQNKLEQIIFKINDFMNKKKHQRYPCLLCMKLIDMFLTPEYVKEYLRAKDSNKHPTHAINYTECIVNVMTYRESPDEKNVKKINLEQSKKVEDEISSLGGKLLERLIDELDFRNLIKEFCINAESFDPSKNNKEAINKLENLIKVMCGIMNVKNYYEISSNDILNSLKILLEKEIRYIEFFKRDKTNEKNPEFNNIVESTSSRMNLELLLNLTNNEISQNKLNYEIYAKNLDLIFLFLTKSVDKKNIKLLLNHLKTNYFFILDHENNIKLQNKENVSEKLTSVDVTLLRKLIEEDDIIYSIISNLTMLAENNIILCNNMVKAGCPRLLLQIIETSPNEENVEAALYLLKLISFSNKNNLQMVASQNALNVLFQTKNKYSSNDKIINQCVEITEEILKLPGQEKYATDLITDTIKEFNENAKKDISQNEIRQKLLNSLQIINSFVTNQSQAELINENEEFIENFKNVTENTFKENELDSLNEKLVSNELSLLKKIKDNKVFKYDYIIDKIIDIIKAKSKYQDILLSATDELLKNLVNQNLYEKYVAQKVDNSFVDCIFDDIDNYLGNVKVTKDLNNILCYLCLYNEDLANYIKQKGGLTNILEELKANINTLDNNNQSMNLNSLKMLYSLCKDNADIEAFLKAGGMELLNKIIEKEIELYKDYKNNFENDLYKTRDILYYRDNLNNKDDEKINESYITYLIKLLKNIIDFDEKYFNNDKMINNLIFLSEVKYPNKELFTELFNVFRKVPKYLPIEEKYLFLLFKNFLCLKVKYLSEKEFIENNINKNKDLILPKIIESQNYFNNLKNSFNTNNNNPLQLTYLSEFIVVNENNLDKISAINEDIEKFALDYFNYYKDKSINNEQEEIPEGIIICLQESLLYLIKIKKTNNLNINDIINTFIFFGQQYLFKNGHNLFSLLFLQKCDSLFDNSENNEDKDKSYKYYLDNVVPKSLEILSNVHQIISNKNDFTSLDEAIELLFELIIKNIQRFYSSKDANLELITFDIIFNVITDLIDDFNNIENIEEEKRKKIINDLYDILLRIMSQNKLSKEDFNNNLKLIMKLLSNIKTSKEKNYDNENNLFAKIINSIIHKAELTPELSEKVLDFIIEDLKKDPPKDLEINLDSLSTISKDISTIKNIINNDEINSLILKIYNDKDNLKPSERRNISTLYNNLLKNTFNVENIIEQKPEIIKATLDKVVLPENIIKDENNIDIPQKELNSIVSILKDKNNSSQVMEKNIITPDNISNIINNYKDVHPSLNESLNDLQNILDILTNKKDKVENYKLDKAILDDLKEKVKIAFDGHLEELKKLSLDDFNMNNINEEPNNLRATLLNRNIIQKKDLLESTSKMKKRRLSLISRNLYYNPYNNLIISPISTKSNDDMSSTLDNLLALIRVLYSNNKDFKDKEIQEKRLSLLKDAFEVLKMFTISPDNHKTVEEMGLLNFMEKLNDQEDFPVYISGLDVVKNCTYSENAVLSLIENKLFDHLIEEVLKFYNNPELLSKNDNNKICFFYDNILLTNISKIKKGFEAFFNKIGIEKLLTICKKTGNFDFLTSFVMVLNNYIENSKLKEESKNPELLKDILEICKKGFNLNVNDLNDVNENLFFKTIKLIGNLYNDNSKDFILEMDIVKYINMTFEKYKDEPEYFYNSIFILKIVCLNHKKYSDEIVDLKLIDKIVDHITTKQRKDDLITNYSYLLNNILVNNEDNRTKMCCEKIINNVLLFIDKYSPKLEFDINKLNDPTFLRGTLINTSMNKPLKESIAFQENDELININLILNNFLKTLNYLSSNEKSNEFIKSDNYIHSLLNTIDKEKLEINNLNLSLFCLGNYYSKINKEEWNNDLIEKIYIQLQSLQKRYYTDGQILININKLIGIILKGLELKFLVERYYSLALEGVNCQDWNEDLILLTLDIVKQCLIKYEDLRSEVFENTEHTILNILKIFNNNLVIQLTGYEILVLFTEKETYAYGLANTDLFSLIKTTLSNKEFNNDPEKRLKVRLAIYKLLNYLAYDKTINSKMSFELMESFVNDLSTDNFTEDLNEMSHLLVTLFRSKLPIEPFIQYSGLDALLLDLDNFFDQKKFILNCIYMIKEICFSSEENKDKLLNLKIQDKIQNIIDKSKPEYKKIKFEGKILVYNLNYNKNTKKTTSYTPPLSLIEKEKMIKSIIYNFMVKGITIKATNPRGKIKEFILAFSPDLMKIYLKKPKMSVIPPKIKYTIETPLVSEVIKDYEIINFKKSGLFNKPPEKQLCFAIIQKLLEGQKAPKKLTIICSHSLEAYQVSGCVEIIVDYIKTKCGYQNICKIDDMQNFFMSLMLNQPKEKRGDRKKTIMLRGKFK